ncbi:Nicotinamide nucleotide repair protein [Anaerohalosphaera lusitana]|uniref:ADP-dependent (S)-NAD(P)H-hydrate dehydratase n=1 Tax=Anaerohalosphaera lusitana TaxID=1936003 RepID=A0A1U9NRL1_9BACT|nr:NAD(P)H-hydrate dehydratase [Anaerohalosphaera lusitana]AQT70166.1 Nicotinamide nucleotide repair protein [Anaerohalosphaera lusitana]
MQEIKTLPTLKPRAQDSHKGTFGRVLVAGGSWGMSGAPAMTALSALRSGAGLVKVACPDSVLPTIASISPCYTTLSLADDDGAMAGEAVGPLLAETEQNDVIAFGPGVTTARGVRDCLTALLREKDLKIVLDADGLNCLAKIHSRHEKVSASAVLTPHPGEMKRLWKALVREDQPADRIEQAAKLASSTGTVVTLKGAGTVVSDGERYYVNETGNPGMSTGGTGDVLTGIIAALIGQGLDNFDASVLGVHLHGLAGDIAAERTGQISLIATDVIDALPQAFRKIQS